MIRERHDDELRIWPRGTQALGIGDAYLHVSAALHDEHRLPHGTYGPWRIKGRQ